MNALRHAPLIAAARLDCLLRLRPLRLSGRTGCGLGLVAVAIVALTYLRGVDVRGALVGSQPALSSVMTRVINDDRT